MVVRWKGEVRKVWGSGEEKVEGGEEGKTWMMYRRKEDGKERGK